nr:TolC family protein [Desulfobulbaceae bacterium]
MKMLRPSVSAIVLLVFFAQGSFATDLITLQKTAVENREIVEQFQAKLEKIQEEQTVAKSGYLPSFDLSYTLNRLDESTAFENEENSVAYGAVTWNLFRGFKDRYTIASARLQRDAEELKLSGIKQDIYLSVALRYVEIFSRKASLRLQEDTHNTLLKSYEDASSRFDVGLIDKNELLRFKVDLDNAKISLKKAEADLAKSAQNLRRAVDRKISIDELTFSEFDLLPHVEPYEQLERAMLEKRSEIRVLEELAAAADLQVKASYAAYYPKVDATTSYRRYDDDYQSMNGSTASEEVRGQLVMSLNIFDGFKKRSTVRKSKLDSRIIQYDLAEMKQDLKTELTNLLLDYDVNVENAAVALSSIEQAQENLRITDLKYKEGLETETDLLDAIAKLSRAKFNHIFATFEVFKNYYQITRAVEGFAVP